MASNMKTIGHLGHQPLNHWSGIWDTHWDFGIHIEKTKKIPAHQVRNFSLHNCEETDILLFFGFLYKLRKTQVTMWFAYPKNQDYSNVLLLWINSTIFHILKLRNKIWSMHGCLKDH